MAVVVVAAGAAGVARLAASPTLSRTRLLAYESAVERPLKDGGRTIEQGMKPALADLNTEHVTPAAVVAREADQWVRDLGDVRARVAAVVPPRPLREAARLFDDALASYVDAARAFGAAAQADALQRGALLDRGYAAAHRADTKYDDAARIVQRWRHRLGLASSPDLPDP